MGIGGWAKSGKEKETGLFPRLGQSGCEVWRGKRLVLRSNVSQEGKVDGGNSHSVLRSAFIPHGAHGNKLRVGTVKWQREEQFLA